MPSRRLRAHGPPLTGERTKRRPSRDRDNAWFFSPKCVIWVLGSPKTPIWVHIPWREEPPYQLAPHVAAVLSEPHPHRSSTLTQISVMGAERTQMAGLGDEGTRRPERSAHKKAGQRHTWPLTCENSGAPGPIRTADTRFRRAVLYPLSYEGMDSNSITGAPATKATSCGLTSWPGARAARRAPAQRAPAASCRRSRAAGPRPACGTDGASPGRR